MLLCYAEGEETPPNIKQSGNAKVVFNDQDYFKHKMVKEAGSEPVSQVDDVRVIEGQQITDTNQENSIDGK